MAARADFPNSMESILWDKSIDIKSMLYVLQASCNTAQHNASHKLEVTKMTYGLHNIPKS